MKVTVEKEVVGIGGTFNFTATLMDGSVLCEGWTLNNNGTSSNPSDDIITGDGNNGTRAGVATFSLSPNANSKVSRDLTIPYGASLTVTEDPGSYETKVKIGSGSESTGGTATLSSRTSNITVKFKNLMNANLTVSKTVTGDFGDRTKPFTFTVEGLPSGESYTYTKEATTDGTTWTAVSGGGWTLTSISKTFTLTDRQRVVIEGLPLNTTFTVTEDPDSYTATWTATDSHLIDVNSETNGKSFKLTGNAEISVTNNLNAVSPTGLRFTYAPFLLMACAGMMLALIARIGRKRRKGKE